MIGRVEHVWFWVADLDRAIAFYTDVLGLPLVRRDGAAHAGAIPERLDESRLRVDTDERVGRLGHR